MDPSILGGVDQIPIPLDAVLRFSHPGVEAVLGTGPLYVHSGANAIKWVYTLNTNVTPTIAGQVVQVLSATAGPMQISGQTAGLKTNQAGKLTAGEIRGWSDNGGSNFSPYHELKAIADWFRTYMELAGSTKWGNLDRDQRAIQFTYSARQWTFYIAVTQFEGFGYDKSTVSPEWAITGEIVSDNALDYFAGVTMSSFTDDLISNQQLNAQIGLSAFANSKTETANAAFGQTGTGTDPFVNPSLGDSPASVGKRFGDNFQGLVAAWSMGNFFTFGFNALGDQNGLPPALSGSVGSGNQNNGNGTGTGSNPPPVGNPTNQTQIVTDINSTFENYNIPGKLGVATAMVESNLDPDKRAANDGGTGIDGVGLFQAHYGGRVSDQEVQDASVNHRSDPPTKWYPAGDQIADAGSWFNRFAKQNGANYEQATDDELADLAVTAQGPQNTAAYKESILANLAAAQKLIDQATSTSGSGSSNWSLYNNPFRDLQGLTPKRIDQGVDFACSADSPIYAIGPAIVGYANNADYGWPGASSVPPGGAIVYTFTDGPAKGKSVYVAENITVLTNVGDAVNSNTVIATLHPGGANLETGWAAASNESKPLNQVYFGAYDNHGATTFGLNFNDFLKAVNGPSGTNMDGTSKASGQLPSGWPTWS